MTVVKAVGGEDVLTAMMALATMIASHWNATYGHCQSFRVTTAPCGMALFKMRIRSGPRVLEHDF